eukprot:GILI01013569.1.p1 GENE.GILI01013569.1~~GILI01013569.1.p1  ORF type:complete len:364 (-),score=84.11 GILI01013569.1:205-1296(-)
MMMGSRGYGGPSPQELMQARASLVLLKAKMNSRRGPRSNSFADYGSSNPNPNYPPPRHNSVHAPPPARQNSYGGRGYEDDNGYGNDMGRAQPARQPPSNPNYPPRRPPPQQEYEDEEEDDGYDDGEGDEDEEDEQGADGPRIECQECGRKFNPESIEKHKRVCKKVFKTKRKAFNAAARRMNPDAAQILRSKRPGAGAASNSRGGAGGGDKKKSNKWRLQSEAFRANIRAAREFNQAVAEGKDVSNFAPPPSIETEDMITCPTCGRRFNEAAGQRHIPKCKDIKAKPKALIKGSGGAGGRTGTGTVTGSSPSTGMGGGMGAGYGGGYAAASPSGYGSRPSLGSAGQISPAVSRGPSSGAPRRR